MIRLQDVEKAIRELSPEELACFREWFAEYEAQMWERSGEKQRPFGLASGKFDVPEDFDAPLPHETLRSFEG